MLRWPGLLPKWRADINSAVEPSSTLPHLLAGSLTARQVGGNFLPPMASAGGQL